MEEDAEMDRELSEPVTEAEIDQHDSGMMSEAQRISKRKNDHGMPSDRRLQETMIRIAQASVDNQAEGTSRLYGNLQDPQSGRGYAREFSDWCKARGGTILNGVLLPDHKEVYGAYISSTAVAFEFLSEYWLLRNIFVQKQRNIQLTSLTSNLLSTML